MPEAPSAWRQSSVWRWGLGLVGLLAAIALGAPFLSPHDPNRQLDPVAGRYLPPGSSRFGVALADGRWLLAEGVERTPAGLRITRLGRHEFLAEEQVVNLAPEGVQDRFLFPLGTDRFGRDLWARITWGARVSLLIGLVAVALALTLGLAVGGLAGVAGGAVDGLLMRLVDALLAFPRLFLVLALAAIFHPGGWVLILVLGGTGWMGVSRLVRAEIRSLRERDFVLAARSTGVGPFALFLRHLLPNALAPVLVDASLRVGEIILVEAALSFLGLGVQPPTPSWGNIIAGGREALTEAPWITAFPGLAIAAAVIGFTLLGDGLRDALDPRFASRSLALRTAAPVTEGAAASPASPAG